MRDLVYRILELFLPVQDKCIMLEGGSGEVKDSALSILNYCLTNNINDEYKIILVVNDIDRYKKLYSKYKNLVFVQNAPKKFSSIKRYYYGIIAKYCLFTHDCPGRRNKGQVKVFITHAAVPLKDSSGASKTFSEYYKYTYILTTSKFAAKLRCKTFGGGEEIARITGLPRNDDLFIEDDNTRNFIKELGGDKLVVWLPTFKHHIGSVRVDFAKAVKSDISLLTSENLDSINKQLKKSNTKLLIKYHPGQDLKYVQQINMSNILSLSDAELQEKNINLYRLLGCSDALITDYSSVYIDYLLLNKPIAFEIADIDNYNKGVGFNVKDPLSLMPGAKISTIDNMLEFLSDIDIKKDRYRKEREALRNKVHKYKDGNSTKRLLQLLKIIK